MASVIVPLLDEGAQEREPLICCAARRVHALAEYQTTQGQGTTLALRLVDRP